MRSPATIILVLIALILSGPATAMLARATQSERLQTQPKTTPNGKPRKRALLVGISKYCRVDVVECNNLKKYWWDLNSEPDLDALKQVLMQNFGFLENEIKVLKTSQETTH